MLPPYPTSFASSGQSVPSSNPPSASHPLSTSPSVSPKNPHSQPKIPNAEHTIPLQPQQHSQRDLGRKRKKETYLPDLLIPSYLLHPPHLLLQFIHPILPIPRHFLNIPRRQLPDAALTRSFPDERFGRHVETHIFGAVDEFEDGGGGLVVVFVEGFDAEDAGVAAGAIQVAGADGGEEGVEVGEGVLYGTGWLD